MDELIAKARRFVRERFRSYQTELKSRGIKRARARRDANRERQDIVTPVKRQLTREISEGRFSASREAVKREVERRVKERMILSRNRNYSRLATASPESDLLRIIRPAPEASARLKPAGAQKQRRMQKQSISSSTFWSIRFPCFNTKYASATGNFAYPHLTARDFPIRLQPFMS